MEIGRIVIGFAIFSWHHEEMIIILNAINNNILSLGVVNCCPGVEAAKWFVIIFETSSFVGCYCPVWTDVKAYSQTGVKGIVGFKWHPEFTDVLRAIIVSLLSIFWSPELILLRPWTIIVVDSPWVSHLDKFLPIAITTL